MELAAGQLARRPLQQRVDRKSERDLLDGTGDGGRGKAAVLERERELGADRPHHDLRLGVLEERADGAGDRSRALVAGVEAGDRHRTLDLTPVEVRNETADGAQECRLPEPGRTGEDDDLARSDLEVDAVERIDLGARIAVAESAYGDRTHCTPLHCANGASAQTRSAIAIATVPVPVPTVSVG